MEVTSTHILYCGGRALAGDQCQLRSNWVVQFQIWQPYSACIYHSVANQEALSNFCNRLSCFMEHNTSDNLPLLFLLSPGSLGSFGLCQGPADLGAPESCVIRYFRRMSSIYADTCKNSLYRIWYEQQYSWIYQAISSSCLTPTNPAAFPLRFTINIGRYPQRLTYYSIG